MIQLSLDFSERSSAPPVAVIDKDAQRRERKNEYERRRYAKNLGKERARRRRRQAENPEKLNSYSRKYAAENPERRRVSGRKWRDANREQKNSDSRKWYAGNLEKERARGRRRYAENREEINSLCRKRYAENPDGKVAYNRKWAAENPEKQRAAGRKYRERNRANPEFVAARREWERAWYKANPGKASAKLIKRRFREEQRTPPWADIDEINTVYLTCPEGMTVDHIVPLLGKTVEGYRVNGLHVPWNLSYLTRSENSGKGNKMRPEDGNTAPLPA
jgi:hypothetical protein